jgi:hypothetical protein
MFRLSDRERASRGSLHKWLVGAVITVCGVAPAAAMAHDTGSRHRDDPTKIDRVVFSGDPTDPTITIYGQEFDHQPSANPSDGTSNLGKCGPIKGNTGNDYGDQLWVSDQSQLWSAGDTPLVDCMGLVVVQYSEHRIVLRLGSFYAINYAQRNGFDHGIYELTPGDTFQVSVEGARVTLPVRYGGGNDWGHDDDSDDWGHGGSPWGG